MIRAASESTRAFTASGISVACRTQFPRRLPRGPKLDAAGQRCPLRRADRLSTPPVYDLHHGRQDDRARVFVLVRSRRSRHCSARAGLEYRRGRSGGRVRSRRRRRGNFRRDGFLFPLSVPNAAPELPAYFTSTSLFAGSRPSRRPRSPPGTLRMSGIVMPPTKPILPVFVTSSPRGAQGNDSPPS